MTLSFSTKWPKSMGELAGQPNYFVEKIWAVHLNKSSDLNSSFAVYKTKNFKMFGTKWIYPRDFHPKLHTIREDKNNRWKAGMDIHFVINNRTKDRFQFAPVVKCVSVQEIEIFAFSIGIPVININGRMIDYEEMKQLAINDGFPSVEAFFDYFNTDFKGKIIHWTDLKY